MLHIKIQISKTMDQGKFVLFGCSIYKFEIRIPKSKVNYKFKNLNCDKAMAYMKHAL